MAELRRTLVTQISFIALVINTKCWSNMLSNESTTSCAKCIYFVKGLFKRRFGSKGVFGSELWAIFHLKSVLEGSLSITNLHFIYSCCSNQGQAGGGGPRRYLGFQGAATSVFPRTKSQLTSETVEFTQIVLSTAPQNSTSTSLMGSKLFFPPILCHF